MSFDGILGYLAVQEAIRRSTKSDKPIWIDEAAPIPENCFNMLGEYVSPVNWPFLKSPTRFYPDK